MSLSTLSSHITVKRQWRGPLKESNLYALDGHHNKLQEKSLKIFINSFSSCDCKKNNGQAPSRRAIAYIGHHNELQEKSSSTFFSLCDCQEAIKRPLMEISFYPLDITMSFNRNLQSFINFFSLCDCQKTMKRFPQVN